MKTLLIVSTILVSTLAKPNGFYHQEYNYRTSSSSYKNHELQHRNDDEGYYSKDGDLEGQVQPRVNTHSQHSEYVNPKLQHGYRIGTDRTESFGQLHAQDRFRMANAHMRPEMGGIMGGYVENPRNYGVDSELRQVTASLEQEMQRELQRAVYDHYQRAAAYGGSITQAQVEADRRVLEEELRRNMTMRLQDALKMHYGNQGIRGSYSYSIINGRLQPTANYDNQELTDLTRQMEANLLRHLNQQVQTYYRVDTQVHTTKNTYRVNRVGDNYPSSIQQRPVYQPYQQPMHHQPVVIHPEPVVIQPQPHPVAPIPDSITTVATRVQTELNEILNKILEDTQRRYFDQNSYHSGVDYDRVLLQLQDELRANITFHFDDQIKRAYGYSNYASKYSAEDIENLRRQIETNLITKLNRDFNRQREKFFQTRRMFVANQQIHVQQPVSIRPIPANHVYYPVANNMNYQHNIEDMQRQLQEQLSRQLQTALMRHSYRQAHMYTGSQTNPEANYQASLSQLSAELNRNLTRQMEMLNAEQYQSGAYASQLANMRSQLQQDLMRQLQQGLQQSHSQYSAWSSSSSSSNANYRPVRGYDPNAHRISGASVDPMGEDCMMGDDPSAYQQKNDSDEDLTQQTENLDQELTQQTQDDDDLTQQVQTHDDLTQQTQDDNDLTQQAQTHDDLTQQTQDDDDLTQQVQTHDDLTQQTQDDDNLTQQVQTHDDLIQQTQENDDDLTQQVQSHDDLTQQVQSYDNLTPVQTTDDLKPQQSPGRILPYTPYQTQNLRDLKPAYSKPAHIQTDQLIPYEPKVFVNDWTQQTRDMTQPLPDEPLHSVPIYERPIEPENVNPLYSKPREEATVLYPSRPAPSRYQTFEQPIHRQPLNQAYPNTYRRYQPTQQYTSTYEWRPQRYPTGSKVSQAVQYYENLERQTPTYNYRDPKINPILPQQTQNFIGQTEFDDFTQQNQNTEFPPLQIGNSHIRNNYRINPKPVVAPSPIVPISQQTLDDDLTQQSQVLVDPVSQDLTQQSQDTEYEPLQIDNSQVRDKYKPYPKPVEASSQVRPLGQQTLDDDDLTQQSQVLFDPLSQDLTQQSQDNKYAPLQIGSAQVRDNYRLYPKPVEAPSQVVSLGQQTLDDDDLTQQSQVLVDPLRQDLTQQTQDLTQQSQDTEYAPLQIDSSQVREKYRYPKPAVAPSQTIGQQILADDDLTQQSQVLDDSDNQDLTQQTEDLTQQTEDLTQQTEDLSQQTEDVQQQTNQILRDQQTQQLSQQTQDMIQQEVSPNQDSETSSLNQQNNKRLTDAQIESQRLIDLLKNHQMQYSSRPVIQGQEGTTDQLENQHQMQPRRYVPKPVDRNEQEVPYGQNTMRYQPKPVYSDIDGQQVGTTRQLPRGRTVISQPEVNYATETQETENLMTVKNIQPIEPQIADEVQEVTDKNTEKTDITTKKPKWYTRWSQSIINRFG